MMSRAEFLSVGRKRSIVLLGLVLLGFGLRLGFVLHLGERVVWPDEDDYITIADTIATQGHFDTPGHPRDRTPVLPYAVGTVFTIFGHSLLVYRVFQAFLGSLLVVLVFYLGREFFDARTGLLASLVAAVYPYFIYMDALLLPQSLLTVLLATSVLLLVRARRKGHPRYWILSGISWGLCILTVPPVLACLPLLGLYILMRNEVGWLRRMGQLSMWVLPIGLVLGAWILRQYVVHDRLIPVVSGSSRSLVLGNNQFATPDHARNPYDKKLYERMLGPERFATYTSLSTSEEKNAYLRAYIRELTLSHPLRAVGLYCGKFGNMFHPVPHAYTKANVGRAPMLISLCSYGPILLLSLGGVVVSRQRWRELIPLYAVVLSIPALYSVFLTTQRYRIPLDVYLILFACYAVLRMLLWCPSARVPNVRPQE